MIAGSNKFKKFKIYKNNIQGYIYKIETTRKYSDNTFHPNIHIFIAAEGNKDILANETVNIHWQKAMNSQIPLKTHVKTITCKHGRKNNYDAIPSQQIINDPQQQYIEAITKQINYMLKDNKMIVDLNHINDNSEQNLLIKYSKQIKRVHHIGRGGILKLSSKVNKTNNQSD